MRQTDNSVRLVQQQNQTILTLQGPFDQELGRSIISLIDKIRPPVVFDLRQVNYLTVAGSRILLGFNQNFGLKPTLRHTRAEIVSFLKLSGAIHYVTLEAESDQPDSN